MEIYLVYLHMNKINKKCYVGQTCQKPSARWGHDGIGYKNHPLFYKAILKYGWDNFEHIILEDNIPKDKINQREIYWGIYYNSLAPNGYNLSLGNNLFSSINNETYSNASKKKWENNDYRNKVIKGRQQMWKNASAECKEKMLSNLDRTGKTGLLKSKKVLCVETGIIYNSTREAERLTKINHSGISLVCNNKQETAGGYHWQYV